MAVAAAAAGEPLAGYNSCLEAGDGDSILYSKATPESGE